ncbi:LysR substrate-binding domain-containing protein [soil metagenome]
MNLQQIEYFVRVAELGSFTRAAAMLNVSQPTLSRHVSQLELELRTHLMTRTGRGIELTEAGKSLLSYGNAITELTRQATEEIQSLRDKPTGRLSVGLPPRVADVLTRGLVGFFRDELPSGTISITEGLSIALREALILGQVEIAILFDPQPTAKLEFMSLFREDLVLCGQPTRQLPLPKRLDATMLPRYPVVVPSMPHANRQVIEAGLRPANIQLKVVAEIDAVQSLVALAQEGHAYAIVPRSATLRGVREGTLKASTIAHPRLSINLVLAFSKARPLSRLARSTVEFMKGRSWEALLDKGHER